MRLTILGGGGFRVPLIYRALLADAGASGITELALYDVDNRRLATIGRVLQAMSPRPPIVTTDLTEALTGATFVFSAIRVHGLLGRVIDERVAVAEGVLGQETVGAGGLSYGLRTVPVATSIAERVAAVAPDAWVINFTNPAGLVTEAMTRRLGDRVIGICDTPAGLVRRVVRALGVSSQPVQVDYAGLNHLGWLQKVTVDGRDRLLELLADDDRLASFEEGRLFGAEWLRTLGMIPNEYLQYYDLARETTAAAHQRGAFLLDQQERLYEALASAADPLSTWERSRRERDETYLPGRDEEDLAAGGYEDVALALMRAIARDEPATLILNVRNRGTLPGFDDDAVVEVPCTVDARGAFPQPVRPLPDHAAALASAVKATDRAVLEAAETGSRRSALRAFATHPLIDSVTVAQRLLAAYEREFPELDYLRVVR